MSACPPTGTSSPHLKSQRSQGQRLLLSREQAFWLSRPVMPRAALVRRLDCADMIRPSAIDLADWQLARDRRATSRFPGLFEHKLERMSTSPLAYLRGAAPLFYKLLADHPELAGGPRGEGWLCGDAHLENFGAFRTEGARSTTRSGENVVFDLNDFDEAIVGPWRVDVLRLVTSLILGGRELGASGRRSVALSNVLLESYVGHACRSRTLPPAPAPVARLLEKVSKRSHRALLAGRTEIVGGRRRFARGERYVDLPEGWVRPARAAFDRYVRRLGSGVAVENFRVLDAAFRIAGTGSLGGMRVAILTRGKGGRDGAWLFDMKEARTPAGAPWLGETHLKKAKRVLAAARACLAHPPRMIGTTKVEALSMFVRRLAPQEDKLSLERLRDEHLEDVAAYLGALLGRAHRRGALRAPREPWSKNELSALVERAIVMAGLHEGAYLAMCRRL
jgi:uncharacterized protein (DUF2252 family)